MKIRDKLLALQWAQLKHDEAYHKDVVILPLAERIKHMALHNGKYISYFLDALHRKDDERFAKVLTDAFIINLASANTLNQNLARDLESTDAESSSPYQDEGALIGKSYFIEEFIRQNGLLCKLCESWDHLEPMNFRDGMKAANTLMLKAVLSEAERRSLNIIELYTSRIRIVEQRSVFDIYYREGAGGEA